MPFGYFDSVQSGSTGVTVAGWAIDPDTFSPIPVTVTADGRTLATTTASDSRPDVARAYGKFGANHGYRRTYVLASGPHRVCVTARNVGRAGPDKALGCKSVSVVTNPAGHLNPIARRTSSTAITVTGWAADPQTTGASSVRLSVDGAAAVTVLANRAVAGLTTPFTGTSNAHGFSYTFRVSTGAHRVSAVAVNVGLGADVSLGAVTAVPANATVPNAPTSVAARAGITSATVSWRAPGSVGGTPLTRYVLTSSPATVTTNVVATATSATVRGLIAGRSYQFTVRAVNLVGASGASVASAAVRPSAAVVTSPALISTSRYIRDINGGSGDAARTRAMGAADATANPSGHSYLNLLQIGGQTSTGVVLSATSTYVTYPQVVVALEAYIDGYASRMRADAPIIISVGTNNDMNVSAATGAIWGRYVINPLVNYVHRYRGIRIAGADDIEPGFIGTPAASIAWVRGFLGSTPASFVFNGSADGCSWTSAHGACNNGWRQAYFTWLAGAISPTRIMALPQIYNSAMAGQWKYISITGVEDGLTKVHFVGPLTEYSACVLQHGGCGSLTNNTAWSYLWAQLLSDNRVAQSSLPYGTDLRID